MILRSLATSIRKQDWFTVLIETLIVVFGVFLGLQLGNWNDARQARADEARTLVRLSEDFKKQEAILLDRIEMTQANIGFVNDLQNLIIAGEEPEDRSRVKALIVEVFGASSREAPPASYEELAASGGFSQLSDLAVRDALARYGQTNALWSYVEGRSQAVRDPTSPLVQAIVLRGGFMEVSDPVETVDYDWEALKDARPALALVAINFFQALDRHQKDLAAVREVLEVLEAAQ